MVTQYCNDVARQYSQMQSNDDIGAISAAAAAAATATESASEPVVKKTRPSLFDDYGNDDECLQAVPSSTTIAAQLNQYLETKFDKETDECLSFWVDNRNIFDKLFIPAIVALSVPASSAPVERVFSFSGIFCRPHRSRISDANLERLTFLRCNQ
jgi:hypothetical protein